MSTISEINKEIEKLQNQLLEAKKRAIIAKLSSIQSKQDYSIEPEEQLTSEELNILFSESNDSIVTIKKEINHNRELSGEIWDEDIDSIAVSAQAKILRLAEDKFFVLTEFEGDYYPKGAEWFEKIDVDEHKSGVFPELTSVQMPWYVGDFDLSQGDNIPVADLDDIFENKRKVGKDNSNVLSRVDLEIEKLKLMATLKSENNTAFDLKKRLKSIGTNKDRDQSRRKNEEEPNISEDEILEKLKKVIANSHEKKDGFIESEDDYQICRLMRQLDINTVISYYDELNQGIMGKNGRLIEKMVDNCKGKVNEDNFERFIGLCREKADDLNTDTYVVNFMSKFTDEQILKCMDDPLFNPSNVVNFFDMLCALEDDKLKVENLPRFKKVLQLSDEVKENIDEEVEEITTGNESSEEIEKIYEKVRAEYWESETASVVASMHTPEIMMQYYQDFADSGNKEKILNAISDLPEYQDELTEEELQEVSTKMQGQVKEAQMQNSQTRKAIEENIMQSFADLTQAKKEYAELTRDDIEK